MHRATIIIPGNWRGTCKSHVAQNRPGPPGSHVRMSARPFAFRSQRECLLNVPCYCGNIPRGCHRAACTQQGLIYSPTARTQFECLSIPGMQKQCTSVFGGVISRQFFLPTTCFCSGSVIHSILDRKFVLKRFILRPTFRPDAAQLRIPNMSRPKP